jgi:hypothetical protein
MFPSSDLVHSKQKRHEIRAILLSFCEVVVAVKEVRKHDGSVSGSGSAYSCRSSFGFHGKPLVRAFNFVLS